MIENEALDHWVNRLDDFSSALDWPNSKRSTFVILADSPERIGSDIATYLDNAAQFSNTVVAGMLSRVLMLAQQKYCTNSPSACKFYLGVAKQIIVNQLRDGPNG